MEDFNFLSLPVAALLGLIGGPLLLRRAGYPVGKTVFGTLTGLMVLLGAWGMIATIQYKVGLAALPFGWLVPLAGAGAGWHWRNRL